MLFPKKNSLNGAIPELVNINVGSFFTTIGADSTISCCFDLKNSKNLEFEKKTSVDELNAIMKDAALNGDLVNQIYYATDPELVSNDIIGNTCCSVFDSNATIVSNDGMSAVIYAWYDNEFGYTKQVIRMAKYITKVRRAIYY